MVLSLMKSYVLDFVEKNMCVCVSGVSEKRRFEIELQCIFKRGRKKGKQRHACIQTNKETPFRHRRSSYTHTCIYIYI